MEKGRKIMIKAIETVWNWRLVLLALLVVLAAPVAHCQQSNTVYTTIGTNVVTTGILAQKPRQIGQSFHLLQVSAATVGVGTCGVGASGWIGDVHMEGSFDNTNWLTIGGTVYNLDVNTQKYITASGSFPYLRINYAYGNTTNCKISIYYSGNVTGSLSTNTIPAVNDGFVYFHGLIIGPDTVAPMNMSCDPGTRLAVYSLYLMNVQGATSTITDYIYAYNSAAPGTPFWQMNIGGLITGTPLVLPNGPRPYVLQSTPNSTITTSTLQANIAAASRYVFTGVGRCE